MLRCMASQFLQQTGPLQQRLSKSRTAGCLILNTPQTVLRKSSISNILSNTLQCTASQFLHQTVPQQQQAVKKSCCGGTHSDHPSHSFAKITQKQHFKQPAPMHGVPILVPNRATTTNNPLRCGVPLCSETQGYVENEHHSAAKPWVARLGGANNNIY